MSSEFSAAPRRRWLVLIVCAASAGSMVLDLTKSNLALPSIEHALQPGPVGLQLIVAGYILSFALTVIPAGWLGDRGLRRRVLIFALGLYVLSSAASALAPGVELLVAARVVQGIAAGLVIPQCMGTMQQLFVGEERARAFGVYGASVSLAVAAGPAVGGLLTTLGGAEHGWRWVFGMNVPLGLILLTGAALLVPRQAAGERRGFDGLGLLLLGTTLVLVLLPLIATTGRPGDDPRRWLLLAAAAVPAALLVWWERRVARRGGHPLLDPLLLRLVPFRNGVAIMLFWFCSNPGLLLSLTLFLQLRLGLSPALAGLMTLPTALCSALSAYFSSRFVMRRGRVVTVTGMLLVLIGMSLTLTFGLTLPAEAAPWAIAASQSLSGLGGGMVISPNHTQALFDVPVDRAGLASSISQLAQRTGTSIGIAASSAVFYGIVFGAADSLGQATAADYDRAFLLCTLLAVSLLLCALVIALLDRVRQHRVGQFVAVPSDPRPA